MDQPGNEVEYLVAVLDAFARHDEIEMKKQDARQRNRERIGAMSTEGGSV